MHAHNALATRQTINGNSIPPPQRKPTSHTATLLKFQRQSKLLAAGGCSFFSSLFFFLLLSGGSGGGLIEGSWRRAELRPKSESNSPIPLVLLFNLLL